MSITAGITAAKASLELTTKLMDLLNRPQIDVVDVRGKVHEMLIHLVNAQAALGEAYIEISDLRHRLDDREAKKALDSDLEYIQDGGFYARKSEQLAIPYCHVCWKKDDKTVPLERTASPGFLRCAIHNTTYETAEYREYLKTVRDGKPRHKSSGPFS